MPAEPAGLTQEGEQALARRPVHLPAAEHVNVQMVNRLAAVFPAVDHGPKPRRQAFFGGKFGRDRQQMPEERRVSPRNMPE